MTSVTEQVEAEARRRKLIEELNELNERREQAGFGRYFLCLILFGLLGVGLQFLLRYRGWLAVQILLCVDAVLFMALLTA